MATSGADPGSGVTLPSEFDNGVLAPSLPALALEEDDESAESLESLFGLPVCEAPESCRGLSDELEFVGSSDASGRSDDWAFERM